MAKIKVVIAIGGAAVAYGWLCLSSASAQDDVIREHSAANRLQYATSVKDKIIPQHAALYNVYSTTNDAAACDGGTMAGARCIAQADTSGKVVKQHITSKSVVGPHSEAENSIVEKRIIVPSDTDLVESQSIVTEAPQPSADASDPQDLTGDVSTVSGAEIDGATERRNADSTETADSANGLEESEVVGLKAVHTDNPTTSEELADIATGFESVDESDEVVDSIASAVSEFGDVVGLVSVGDDVLLTDDVSVATVADEDATDADNLDDVISSVAPESTAVIPTADIARSREVVEIDAIVGESVQISLDGVAWRYAGTANNEQVTAVNISSIRQQEGITYITMAFDSVGTFSVLFQNIDSATGTIVTQPYSVQVYSSFATETPPETDSQIPDIQPQPLVADGPVASSVDSGSIIATVANDVEEDDIASATDSDVARLIALAGQLLADGKTMQARRLVAELDTSQPLPPQVAEEGAMLATTLNLSQVARRLWEQNVNEREPYRHTALSALVELSIASGSLASADIYLQSMLQYNISPSEEALLVMADYYLDSARFEEARALLTLFSESYPDSQYFDGLLWNRGRLHEANRSQQNIWSAVRNYRELIASYPLSDYWEQAQARAIYLERHFIDVR